MKLEQALSALPELDELRPLREALIGISEIDRALVWSGGGDYATLDKRIAEPAHLESQITALAERVRERTERVYRHVVASLAALERRDAAGAARELVLAGEVEEGARRLDAAEQYYAKALELGRKPRDRRVEGLALRRLARVARARSGLDRALQLYRQGYEVAAAQRDVEGAVVGCQGVGNVYVDQGQWAAAREWYQRGLELLPEAGGRLAWELYNNMAIVELRTGQLDASATWLDRIEQLLPALNDPAGYPYLLNGRGLIAMARGEHAQAESLYREAAQRAGEPHLHAAFLLNLSEALLEQDRLLEAEEAVRAAEYEAIRRGLTQLLPETYRRLGQVAQRHGDAEGFLFFEQALDLCQARGLPLVQLAITQEEYGRFELAVGNREAGQARLQRALELYQRLELRLEAERVETLLDAAGDRPDASASQTN